MRTTTPDLQDYTRLDRAGVAISAMFGYGLDFYNLIIMSFLFTAIQSSLGMTLPQAGLIVSVTLAASVVGGIGVGILGDRIGRKNALLVTLLLLAAGAILSALAWDFTSLLAFRAITGIGVGGEWGVGIVLFNEVWDRRSRGLGSGVVQAMAGAGTALASIVAAFTLTHFSADMAWRISVAVGGLPLLLMVFVRTKMPESKVWLAYNELKRSGTLPPEKVAEKSPLREIMSGSFSRFFVLGTMMTAGYIIAYQSVSLFLPVLMSKVLHASPGTIRDLTLIWAVVLAAGMILTGYVSDAFGRKISILLAATIGGVGFVGLYLTGAITYGDGIWGWPLFWAYLVWGFGQGGAGQFGCWLAELYPVELRTTAASTIYTAGRLVGAIAPYVVPTLAAAFGNLLDAIMFGLLGVAVSLAAACFLPETAGRQFRVIERPLGETEAIAAGSIALNRVD